MSLSGTAPEVAARLRPDGRREASCLAGIPARRAAVLGFVLALAWSIAIASVPAAAQIAATRGDVELGAVVDVRRADPGGLRVMAVTPGGAADRIGLRAGDRLQTLNGQRLAGTSEPAPALAQALRASGGTLQFELLRDGKPVRLSGPVDLRTLPAGAGCGQVTDLLDGLPAASNVRRVDITQIEGRNTAPAAAARHPVASGTRVLIVREHVPAQPPPQRPLSSYARKAFLLEIEPDTTYHIGARPLSGNGAEGAWQPFVWQATREGCP
jgi:membrane-associated protease RseP (regulator of RpoE activity)